MDEEVIAPDRRRFIIAISALIVMLLIWIGLFSHNISKDIDFVEKELDGVEAIHHLYQHMQMAQKLRGLRQLQTGGYTGIEAEIAQLYKDLLQLLIASRDANYAVKFRLRPELEGLIADVQLLEGLNPPGMDSLTLFDRYTRFNLDLLAVIRRAADNSNLSLDPVLESYLLGQLVIDLLPTISEHIAVLRGLTAYAAQRPTQFARVAPRLQYRLRAVTDEMATMQAHYRGLFHREGAAVGINSAVDLLRTSISAYTTFVETALDKGDFGSQPYEVFVQGSATVEIVTGLLAQVHGVLSGILQERKARLVRNSYIISFAIFMAGLFLIAMVLNYYRSNQRTHAKLLNARAALASANAHNAAIIRTVLDGIISIDAKGIIHDCNPAAEKIFGYSASEIVGQKINMLMPEPYAAAHDGYINNYLTTGKKHIIGSGREVEGRRKDGSVFPMDLAVNEMQINGQRYFTGVVRDITERKRIEIMKNEFVSTVSHELRTPLTSIRGSLGLALGGVGGELSDRLRELLTIAAKNSERLLVLIGDILDLQKIESGKMTFKFAPVDVNELLEEAVKENSAYASQYGIHYELQLPEYSLSVFADRERLLQVMANLLSNAAKFSPPGDVVRVVATRHSGRIRISVTDHGEGIPENFRRRIFEKFSQSDASDSRSKCGTGLGLSIAKLIVEGLHGHIDYQTRAGEGTTFFFDLPEH